MITIRSWTHEDRSAVLALNAELQDYVAEQGDQIVGFIVCFVEPIGTIHS